MTTTYVIVGGGTAGCVMAARLSEDRDKRVILIEAGMDYRAAAMPEDIAASYAGRALYNPEYFWRPMTAMRHQGAAPARYEQARIIGGGSSINGQVALRGAPADFDRWEELGAAGWNWRSVLPYFRKLETDLDFVDQFHGASGPIKIHRVKPENWDGFTHSIVATWAALGHRRRDDMNGSFEDGYAAVPVSHDGQRRNSTATGYLNDAVRARENLTILTRTEARRLVFDNRRVTGVEVSGGGVPPRIIAGDHIVLCAGALRSPWLMLKSGIGPADTLHRRGIRPILDLPGVGRNLQDHPTVSVAAYTAPAGRRKVFRHNFVNLVYSSGIDGAPQGDMVMSAICKTAWHALGDRFSALSTYIGKPYSRGHLDIDPHDIDAPPAVTFNWLGDSRDVERARRSVHMMSAMLRAPEMRASVLEVFAAGYSPRVKKMGALTLTNRLSTAIAGVAMDVSAPFRREIVRRFAADGVSLDALLADDDAMRAWLRATTTGIWHPSGTCKMGRADDAMSVVDGAGKVRGIENLTVADASIMPEIPTTNLNVPAIMIGEKIADTLRGTRGASNRVVAV